MIRTKLGLASVGALALLSSFAVPTQASAQGFFELLFRGFGESRPRVSAPAYAPPGYGYDERVPRREYPHVDRPVASSGEGRGAATNCVRLCDGRYFPLPRSASNGAKLDPVKVCSALCPAAKTQVFSGSNMQHASAADGTRYADLDTAFAFRDKVVSDCSCTGQGPGGLAQIDVESDPTLKVGDVVITATGPAVFRGAKQFPYQSADFTPVDDYGRLNSQLRQKLSELQVNASAVPAMPPQKLAADTEAKTTDAKPVQKRVRRAAPRQATAQRASTGFPFFSW